MAKSKFAITPNEWLFVAVMTVLAIAFNNKPFLVLLNQVNPILGFLIYYVIVYASLALMSYLGLVVFGVKVKHPVQVLGTGLVLFAFFLIFNWTNPFVQYATTGHFEGVSNVFVNNSEDGLMWWFYCLLIHPDSTFKIYLVWFLTFPVTVFLATLIAMFLIHRKPSIS